MPATTQVCALIAFLHCDLVRKTFVAKLGVRLQIRAKSLYQLFEVIQFLKLFNRIVRGQFSLGQTLQVIALGQKHTSPYVVCVCAVERVLCTTALRSEVGVLTGSIDALGKQELCLRRAVFTR